jgi:serine/threonine protein kinase
VKGAFIRKSKVLVAIKTIDRNKVAGKVSEKDLLQERTVHAKLKHNNIIKILSHFAIDKIYKHVCDSCGTSAVYCLSTWFFFDSIKRKEKPNFKIYGFTAKSV